MLVLRAGTAGLPTDFLLGTTGAAPAGPGGGGLLPITGGGAGVPPGGPLDGTGGFGISLV